MPLRRVPKAACLRPCMPQAPLDKHGNHTPGTAQTAPWHPRRDCPNSTPFHVSRACLDPRQPDCPGFCYPLEIPRKSRRVAGGHLRLTTATVEVAADGQVRRRVAARVSGARQCEKGTTPGSSMCSSELHLAMRPRCCWLAVQTATNSHAQLCRFHTSAMCIRFLP